MNTALVVSSLVGGSAVLAWRMREASRPVTVPKIVIPPLGMSTGFCMFFYPPARIDPLWGVCAFVIGALLLSYPLIKTTTLVREGDHVMMQRSKAFLPILLALFAVRFAARSYVENLISAVQTGSLFFVLAFGMIVRWRTFMLIEYRRLMR